MTEEQLGNGINGFFANPTWITLIGLGLILTTCVVLGIYIIKSKKSKEAEQSSQATTEAAIQIIKNNNEVITNLAANLENEKSYKHMVVNILEMQKEDKKNQNENNKVQDELNLKMFTSIEKMSINIERSNAILENLEKRQELSEKNQKDFQYSVIQNQQKFEEKVSSTLESFDNNLNTIKEEVHDLKCNQIRIESIKKLNEKDDV